MSSTKLLVVQEDTAEKFQETFNSKMSELSDKDPKYEFNHSKGYCAYIIYSDNSQLRGTVERTKHRCICDSCMRCQEPGRPRVKWRKCDIYGSVRRDTSCDDYIPGGGFYGN